VRLGLGTEKANLPGLLKKRPTANAARRGQRLQPEGMKQFLRMLGSKTVTADRDVYGGIFAVAWKFADEKLLNIGPKDRQRCLVKNVGRIGSGAAQRELRSRISGQG